MVEYSNAKKILTRNNWKRLVGRTACIRRHSKQSNGTLRLCRYRLGDLGWSSNGSGVSLRSVGIGLGSLRCSRWSSSRWLEDAEEIRLNGRIRWTWRPWIEWFKGPMLESYQIDENTSDFDDSWLLFSLWRWCGLCRRPGPPRVTSWS